MAKSQPDPGIGHNSDSIAADELRQFIERLERLIEERKGIQGDIAEVMAEAKGRGFDAKTIRKILKIRSVDHAQMQEEAAILELYCQALGMENFFA